MFASVCVLAWSLLSPFGNDGPTPEQIMKEEIRVLQDQVSNLTLRVTQLERKRRPMAAGATRKVAPKKSDVVFGVSSAKIQAGMNLLGEKFPVKKSKNLVIETKKLPPPTGKKILKRPTGKPTVVTSATYKKSNLKPDAVPESEKPSSEKSINDVGGVK